MAANGTLYAPGIIEKFVRVVGDTLKLYYTTSTWNPYTIVRMRSEFLIVPGSTVGVGRLSPVSAPRLAVAPNPFRSGTRVSFSTAAAGPADVGVYDVAGRLVRRLHHGVLPAGQVCVRVGRDDRLRRRGGAGHVLRAGEVGGSGAGGAGGTVAVRGPGAQNGRGSLGCPCARVRATPVNLVAGAGFEPATFGL